MVPLYFVLSARTHGILYPSLLTVRLRLRLLKTSILSASYSKASSSAFCNHLTSTGDFLNTSNRLLFLFTVFILCLNLAQSSDSVNYFIRSSVQVLSSHPMANITTVQSIYRIMPALNNTADHSYPFSRVPSPLAKVIFFRRQISRIIPAIASPSIKKP